MLYMYVQTSSVDANMYRHIAIYIKVNNPTATLNKDGGPGGRYKFPEVYESNILDLGQVKVPMPIHV